MKSTIVITVLFGLSLTPSLAGKNVDRNKQISTGENSHQTLSINKEKSTACIDMNDGRDSWNIIWNYNTGYMATRIFAQKVCFISKMNKNVMPDIVAISKMTEKKKRAKGQRHPSKDLVYVVSKKRVRDLKSYGEDIFALCKGLPTYIAHEVRGSQFWYNQGSCFQLNILFVLGIRYCDNTGSS
ncbi:gastrokine-1 [Struthio camelus]|uniref:gastrokine-1 n=1 Tax=Struthio camelus TaxID=8801 RepID=UPI003603F5F4